MSFIYMIPEIYFFSSIVLYLCSFFFERNTKFLFFLLLQSLFILLFLYVGVPTYNFSLNSLYSVSGFTFLIKLLSLGFFILFIIIFFNYLKNEVDNRNLIDYNHFTGFFEYSFISLLFLFSGFFFLSVNDMLLIYIFLELQSLCLYVLAAFSFESIRSAEAALKYFFFGAQFSGVFLLGWILLYYNSGQSNLFDYFEYFSMWKSTHELPIPVEGTHKSLSAGLGWEKSLVGGGFGIILIGFAIISKLGLFPAYFWMIDVYDGVSNISVFFFSVFPKLVLISFLVRLHVLFYPYLEHKLFNLAYTIVAVGSILFCAILNFSQWRVKRFMAFSSVVNLGYILMFFTTFDISEEFFIGIFLNLFSYIVLVTSFFIIYLNLKILNRSVTNIVADINELFLLKNSGFIGSFLIGIIMLAFAGVPPLMGFFGKYYLVVYLFENDSFLLLTVVLLGSLLSAFYYIRLARILFNFNSGFLIISKVNGIVYFFLFILLSIQLFFFFCSIIICQF